MAKIGSLRDSEDVTGSHKASSAAGASEKWRVNSNSLLQRAIRVDHQDEHGRTIPLAELGRRDVHGLSRSAVMPGRLMRRGTARRHSVRITASADRRGGSRRCRLPRFST
jgi:hypothetical protein